MNKEIGCEGCFHEDKCLSQYEVCPCRICIVKVMCDRFCYERHLAAAKGLKLQPMSRESFERFQRNNKRG